MTETAELVDVDGWRGYAALVPLLAPIDSIESHPENPRRGNIDVVADSLRIYGQTKPIIVQDSTGYIVAGNHTRLAAMERLGWTQIAAVRAALTDEEALGYLMMDNRSSDLGSYDETSRIEILERLRETGRLDATGYSSDELDAIVAAANKAANAAVEEFDSGYSEPDEPATERPTLAGETMREHVLLFTEAEYAQFITHVKICQREWGLSGPTAVVIAAVKKSAETC